MTTDLPAAPSADPAHQAAAEAARLAALLRAEHHAMAEFLVALAAFDGRRGWAALGHASLWHFLHRGLGLSKGAAFQRKEAARLLVRFSAVEAPLRDGRLCLSSVAEAAKVLTADNLEEVLPRFFHRSAREAREVVAALAPSPVVPTRVVVTPLARARRGDGVLTSEPIATMTSTPSARPEPVEGRAECPGLTPTPTPAANPPPAPTPTPAAVAPPPASHNPLTADLRRLHLTVSRRFLAKLDAARDARSHAAPGAPVEAILEQALDLLLAREAKRREAKTDRPPAKLRSAAPDRIPAHVRREVWERDEGRCQWPLHGGGICGSTRRVEVDHVVPEALGGPPTAENLRLLCRAHNQEAARRVFGEAWMASAFDRRRPAAPIAASRPQAARF